MSEREYDLGAAELEVLKALWDAVSTSDRFVMYSTPIIHLFVVSPRAMTSLIDIHRI